MNKVKEIDHLHEIHQSNISTVFVGIDKQTGEKVAIKVLNEEYPSPNTIARFNEEAELGINFQIEGLRKVICKQKFKNRHALVMEYIEGKSFQELLVEESGQITLELFLKLAIRTTDILHEIHKYGIIHKDINPKNLILGNDKDVHIIDLGIATLSKRENAQLEAPDKLEGTLDYIAPEQTGRMNHSIDTRSDLYSLGITFYEMLTGNLPFESADSMELVHSHIAKTPINPNRKNHNIPSILSDIVMKLMSKNSDDRYQTALGLKHDLIFCQNTLASHGTEALQSLNFDIGKQDFNSSFQIPEKLYGRDEEIKLLLNSFKLVKEGASTLLTVGGYSGVGKTALIEQLYKPVTENHSYFISGKFDQFQKDIPYSAIIHAINSLVQQLLGESEARLQIWKKEIIQTLGSNAGVLTAIVPSLELIIGNQPSPLELPPVESQNRFNAVIQKFFRDLSTRNHALVLFVDDWQWADLPSLNLLKLLSTDTENQYFMIITAYRDNEVDSSHPFVLTLEDITKASVQVNEIILKPLDSKHVLEIVQDTLMASKEKVITLSALIEKKTSGNPFFVTQFLQRLHDGGYIQYNSIDHCWKWDIEQIQLLPISNNVLDLMTSRIEILSLEAQKIIQLASCIGSYFPLKLLSYLYGATQSITRPFILEAINQGLLLPHKGSHYSIQEDDDSDKGIYFRFLHDRVEQAAYQMLDSNTVKQVQWKIGQAILSTTSTEYQNEFLFDIVNFLNNGKDYAGNSKELKQLAHLNYLAGKKAKKATAYASANIFLLASISSTGSNLWQEEYTKAFDVHKELAESFFLQGNFEQSDKYIAICLENASSNTDKVSIHKIQIAQLSGQGKFTEAVQIAIDAISLFDIPLPRLDESAKIEAMTGEQIQSYIGYITENSIEALAELPECTNDDITQAMELMSLALDSAAIGVTHVFALITMKMNTLSIQHGLCASSVTSFALTAMVYGPGFKDYNSAFKIVSLALKLAESRKDTSHLLPKIYHMYGYYSHAALSLRESAKYQKKAYETGLEVGDFVYGSYGLGVLPRYIYPISITEGLEATQKAHTFFVKINNVPMIMLMDMQIGFARAINGEASQIANFNHGDFSEDSFVEIFTTAAPMWVSIYKRYKLQAAYILQEYEQALPSVEERNTWIGVLGGIDMGWRCEYYLFCGLSSSMFYQKATNDEDKVKNQEILTEAISEIKHLLDSNEEFIAMYELLIAEQAFLEGKLFDAMDLYDSAIEHADKKGFPQYIAIASERAMQMFLRHNKKDIARIYYQKSLYAYENWGAVGKVHQMHEQYVGIFPFASKRKKSNSGNTTNTITSSNRTSIHTHMGGTTSTGGGGLDLLSVMKASQAISQEIKLDLLLKNMISVLMENAGAERALLIQDRGENLMLAAEAHVGKKDIEVMRELPLEHEDAQSMALSIIRTVYRTEETIVLDDVRKDPRFAIDDYVKQGHAKSILCMPIMTQGKVRVVIYMEHNSITGAFTEDRLQVLNMLSSQVGISIENANLYDTMEIKVAERTAELQEKNARITDSINYALTMQQAILPSEDDLKRISDDFFVLFLPKDIVSGDFYWHTTIGNKEILAVIDCTGHGVPGAFMSMIGNTLLNEIVNQKEIINPAEIMEMLDLGVQVAMHQETGQNSDGMDLTLCVFEKLTDSTTKIEFTGAKNSLYFTKDGMFGKLDAERRAIGGFGMRSKGKPFTTQELILDKGDTVYMITDGYVDSAGEHTKRSFSKKRFFDLISEHWQEPMTTQYDIFTKALKDFQGAMHQRDDITVIGFKM